MALYKNGKKVSQTDLNPSTSVDDKKALHQALLEEFKEQGLTLDSEEPLVKDLKSTYPTVDKNAIVLAWSEYTLALEVADQDNET